MPQFEISEIRHRPAAYQKAECDVRYWEDGLVNGQADVEGILVPCRDGDIWSPVIHLATGRIEDWPEGTAARIHLKVCSPSHLAPEVGTPQQKS